MIDRVNCGVKEREKVEDNPKAEQIMIEYKGWGGEQVLGENKPQQEVTEHKNQASIGIQDGIQCRGNAYFLQRPHQNYSKTAEQPAYGVTRGLAE